VYFVESLPKTRSGKIMRRVLKAVAQGKSPGDLTTLEDETSVEEVKRAYECFKRLSDAEKYMLCKL
jgi:acetyl-CoA synthetase